MRLGRLFRRLVDMPSRTGTRIDRDLEDEMRFHIDMRATDLMRMGANEPEARRQAEREFGDANRFRRVVGREDRSAEREQRLSRWMADFSYDVRFAWRQVARNRLFATIAIFTVAIGIGANTAIMSAVRGIILRPLPFESPENLVRVQSRSARLGVTAVSVPDFGDWRAQTTTFERMAAWYTTTSNLSGDGEPERLEAAKVSDNWFDLLGVRPLAGRTFVAGEEDPAAPIRAVLSDALWRRRFSEDSSVIGRTIRLDGKPVEIIGVVQAERAFPPNSDLWMTTRFAPDEFFDNQRGARWLRVLARLKAGVTLAQADEDVARVAKLLEQRDPRHNEGYGAVTVTLQESIIGDYRRPLFILLGAVGLVMLVVCANVAGLMVARTASRDTEIAVRSAIGAGRGRIVRQLVTEALVLALAGGTLGFGFGVIGTYLLVRFAPPGIPRLPDVGIDATTFAFSLALAVITGVAFGLAPAIQASRHDVRTRLQADGRGMAGRSGSVRLRRVLVVSELAVAIVLLVCAGLLLRSFAKLQGVDPGFTPSGLTAFTVTLPETRYAQLADQRQFTDRALERLKALPGVEHAAASFGLPLTDARFQLTFTIDRKESADRANEPRGQVRVASTDYFETMGIPLLEGRAFTAQDRWDSPQVMVVSQELARRFFPNGDAIGHYIETGWGRDGRDLGGEIVGIVGDVKQFGLSRESPPAYYAAASQWPTDEISFVLRGAPDVSIARGIREAIKGLDDELPFFDFTTGETLVSESLAQPRFYLMVIAAFATAALLLAAIGVYGIIAYTVRQRTREIGVRMALGASASQVVRMVVGEGLVLAGIGLAVGVAIALVLADQIRDLLFRVDARDWITLVSVGGVLVLAAIVACLVPARSAARLGPQEALRGD